MRGVRGRQQIGALLAVLAIVGSACNSKLLRPPALVFVDGGEHVISTTLNEVQFRFPSVFTAFLPSQIPLHAGDALNFQLQNTGEPHTVALGRTIDKALSAVEALGVSADLPAIEKLPAMRQVPSVFPSTLDQVTPVINRSAAEPCFLRAGAPAVSVTGGAPACPKADQPTFDGKQSFYSSGVIQEGEPFRVKLSGDIVPGTYHFMCLVHRSSMTGTIQIVDKTTDRPTVAELRKAADDEEKEIATSLDTPTRDAVRREGGQILAGTGPHGNARGELSAFMPRDSKAEVNRAVGWSFYGMHSISFRPSHDAKEGVLIGKRGGTIRANPDAFKPVGGPPVPARIFSYPPPVKGFSIDGGTWDGSGTFSSGVIRATPPASVSYVLRFSKPGTYKYSCVVHDSMRGTIQVR